MTNYGPAQDPQAPRPPWPPPGQTLPSSGPGPHQGYPPPGRCPRCQRDLVPHAVACAYCGERLPTAGRPQAGQTIVATGRRRRAGYYVCGGGGAIAISVLLPWISVAGIASANLSGGGVAMLLALGGGLIYLGARVLKERVTRTAMTVLWVLAGIELLLILVLLAEVSHADGESGGLATPAAGFYIAVAGLVAATAGTIMLQTTRPGRSVPPPAGAPLLSADRSAWWDGQAWRDAARQPPPGHPRSPDGQFWWDGYGWRPLGPS